jgi:hypothetical protein
MVDEKDSYPKQEMPRKNLAHGEKIESVLKACKKLDLADRSCFAQNLGQIIKNLIRKNKSLTLRKIFIKAFGNSAESLYKKRKSLVSWPEEDTIPEKLRSKARDYLLIIQAISEFESEFSSDSKEIIKQRLILALISQSSFNDSRNTRDRLYEESKAHYKKQLNRLVNKVVESCDLDYMFHFSENHFQYGSINVSRMGLNSTAPRVKIADIFLKQETKEFAIIEIDSKENEIEIERELRKQIIKDGMRIPYVDDYADDWDVTTIPWDVFSDWRDGFWCLETHSDSYYEYFIPSDLYLEVRYDPVMYRWIGVLVWDCEDRISHDNFNLNTYNLFGGPQKDYDIFHLEDGSILCARHISSPKGKKKYMLYWHESTDPFPRELFQESGGFRSKKMLSYEEINDTQKHQILLSAKLDDIDEFALSNYSDPDFEVIPCEELYESRNDYGIDLQEYTPAPFGSFAHIILHNLAYAPIEKRLDTLLIKDAIEKHAEFKKLEKEITKEYFSKINRLV